MAERPIVQWRGGRCQQRNAWDQEPDGMVYVANARVIYHAGRGSVPVVSLHVIGGRVELSMEDAAAVRDALSAALDDQDAAS